MCHYRKKGNFSLSWHKSHFPPTLWTELCTHVNVSTHTHTLIQPFCTVCTLTDRKQINVKLSILNDWCNQTTSSGWVVERNFKIIVTAKVKTVPTVHPPLPQWVHFRRRFGFAQPFAQQVTSNWRGNYTRYRTWKRINEMDTDPGRMVFCALYHYPSFSLPSSRPGLAIDHRLPSALN